MRPIRTIACSLIVTFVLTSLYTQGQVTLFGNVFDHEGGALEYAYVSLHTAVDSNVVDVTLTDERGGFIFRSLAKDTFFLLVNFVGLPTYTSSQFGLPDRQSFYHPSIRLSSPQNLLEQVEVTASRPVIQVKPDKIIFDVANAINPGGGNALTLLRRAPGVVVSNSDEITLLGQPGVQIYLDGKRSLLSGSELTDLLRSMTVSEIESIEIITNPSSRYEAQGSGGIINIRVKRDKDLGFNSNLNLNYSLGKKQWLSGRISTNYRKGKLNIFGNYGPSIGENISNRRLTRVQQMMKFDQESTTSSEWTRHSYEFGIDYYLAKQSTLGFRMNGRHTDFRWFDKSRTPIYDVATSGLDSILVSQYDLNGNRHNMSYNLNYRVDDYYGYDVSVDLDYLNFRKPDGTIQPNFTWDASEELILNENLFEHDRSTNIDVIVFKADVEGEILAGDFEAGLKTDFSRTDNDFEFFERVNGTRIISIDRTNRFLYKEGVTAVYFQYARQLEKFEMQMGLRGEHTYSRGELSSLIETRQSDIRRNYFDVFPSFGFTYELNDRNSFQVNYSRRINRPSYEDLNPFREQKDELSFEEGNPFLNPEYTGKFQIAHSFNSFIYSSIGYSRTRDLIVSLRDTLGSSGIVRKWVNLAKQENYSLSSSFSYQIKKWWSTYSSLTGYYRRNYADYGGGKVVDVDATAFYLYSQHTFSLPKSLSAELSGWYNSPSISGASYKSNAIWSLDFGIQKKILDKRGKLSLNVSDIFKSSGWYGTSRFGDLVTTSSGYSDSRRLSIYFSYLFGNERLKESKRKSGIEDIDDRINSKRSDND